MANQDNYLS